VNLHEVRSGSGSEEALADNLSDGKYWTQIQPPADVHQIVVEHDLSTISISLPSNNSDAFKHMYC